MLLSCLFLFLAHALGPNDPGHVAYDNVESYTSFDQGSFGTAAAGDNYLVYLVYHDDASYDKIRHVDRPWIRKLRIPSTVLFESFSYHLIAARRHEWAEKDYVGLLTYAAEDKVPGILDRIESVMAARIGADAYVWNDDWIGTQLYEQAVKHIGQGFVDAWERLFAGGANSALITPGDPAQRRVLVFYNNYWALRTSLFPDFYAFFAVLAARSLEDTALREALYGNATYSVSDNPVPEGRLEELSGRRHYTHHPFVFERVPAAYAALRELDLFLSRQRMLVSLREIRVLRTYDAP